MYKHIMDSYKGIHRDENKDGLFNFKLEDTSYYMIFDGVGLSKGAKYAIDYARAFFRQNADNFVGLNDLIYKLNNELLQSGIDEPYTTICAIRLSCENAEVVSIGDSRCYLVCDSYFEQLTEDDTYNTNVLSKCLGKYLEYNDIEVITKSTNDDFLLCTDGFYNLIEKIPSTIHQMLKKHSKASVRKEVLGKNSDDASYIYLYKRVI